MPVAAASPRLAHLSSLSADQSKLLRTDDLHKFVIHKTANCTKTAQAFFSSSVYDCALVMSHEIKYMYTYYDRR